MEYYGNNEIMIIQFETAKIAKEKGFNIVVSEHYESTDKIKFFTGNNSNINESYFSAPEQHELQKWLREVHNIHINVFFSIGNKYWWQIVI